MRSQGLLLASQWLLLRSALASRPADSDAELLGLDGGSEGEQRKRPVVPSYLEDTFPGSQIWSDLKEQKENLTEMKADGLFSLKKAATGRKWRFEYGLEDKGVPYGSTEPKSLSANTSFEFKPARKFATVELEARFFQDLPNLTKFDTYLDDGINYAGRIVVSLSGSNTKSYIYVPGTKTYDIAGMTGDPHASERIGPACSKVIMAITTAAVAAFRATGKESLVRKLFRSNRKLIDDLHGRQFLVQYMFTQIREAFAGRPRITYAQFVKRLLEAVTLQPCFEDLHAGSCHNHTVEYLKSSKFRYMPRKSPQTFYDKICADMKSLKDTDIWKAKVDPEVCKAPGL